MQVRPECSSRRVGSARARATRWSSGRCGHGRTGSSGADLRGRGLSTARKPCSAGGEGLQKSVRAAQGPTTHEEASADCGGGDVSPGGGDEGETEVRGQVEHRHLLGLIDRSNMVPVGTTNGVVNVNCIMRLPINDADPELFMSIRGYPLALKSGEVPTLVASDPVVPEDEHATTLADRAGGRSGTQTGAKQSKRLSCRCTASRTAAESGRAPEKHPEAWRQRTQSASEADDVERSRVELNRRPREEAGTARQPRRF